MKLHRTPYFIMVFLLACAFLPVKAVMSEPFDEKAEFRVGKVKKETGYSPAGHTVAGLVVEFEHKGKGLNVVYPTAYVACKLADGSIAYGKREKTPIYFDPNKSWRARKLHYSWASSDNKRLSIEDYYIEVIDGKTSEVLATKGNESIKGKSITLQYISTRGQEQGTSWRRTEP